MKTSIPTLIVSFFLIIVTSCENEPVDMSTAAGEIINVNSELYDMLVRTTDDGSGEDITCIEFVYPLTIYTFDENLEQLTTEFLINDQQFSILLGGLESNYSISISYPITSNLNNGTIFTIETNEELKEAIDNCIREEAIGICQQLIKTCVWKVIYLEGTDNTYLGGIFLEANGATSLTFDGEDFIGSWSPLFIEDELHLNIHLNYNNDTSAFWNRDWLITYIGSDAILLTQENESVLLKQFCEDNTACVSTGLDYKECELIDNPDHAEFLFDDYKTCLLTFFIVDGVTDAENVNIAFFETNEDSETNNNSIITSETYINISQGQIIWVRIENLDTFEYIVYPITLTAISC